MLRVLKGPTEKLGNKDTIPLAQMSSYITGFYYYNIFQTVTLQTADMV